MDGAGAAGAEQRVVAGVAAALRDVHACGPRHVLVHDVVNSPGHRLRGQLGAQRDAFDGRAGGVDLDFHLAPREVRRVQIAEEKIRVGHRRLDATEPVRRGPRM